MHERWLFLNDWRDGSLQTLREHFGITSRDLQGIEILLASYNLDDYQGEAFVLFVKDGVLYEVNGCHDALDDMHGQWEPEDTLYRRPAPPHGKRLPGKGGAAYTRGL